MIFDALVTIGSALLSGLISLFPDGTFNYPTNIEGVAAEIAAKVGPINAILPLAETLTVATIALTVIIPAMIAYRAALLVWSLLPMT